MAVRLQRNDDLPHLAPRAAPGPGLKDIVRRCCELAAGLQGEEPDEASVHHARRLLKRARALLRLGESLGVGGAKAARRRLARFARALSTLRDATVATKRARRIARRRDGDEQTAAIFIAATEPAPHGAEWWLGWKRGLAAEIRRLRGLKWREATSAEVRRALQESAGRMRQREKKLRASHTLTRAHEWRKAVIGLREQLMAVRPLLGREAGELAEQLHELARQLGKATDWNVFLKATRQRRWPKDLAEGRSRLRARARKRRKRAIKKALKRWQKLKHAWPAGFEPHPR